MSPKFVKRCIRGLAVVVAALALFGLTPSATAAPCSARSEIVKFLGQHYTETAQAGGIAAGGVALVEVYVSPRGTWTILLSAPNGTSCVIAAGTDWATKSIGSPKEDARM